MKFITSKILQFDYYSYHCWTEHRKQSPSSSCVSHSFLNSSKFRVSAVSNFFNSFKRLTKWPWMRHCCYFLTFARILAAELKKIDICNQGDPSWKWLFHGKLNIVFINNFCCFFVFLINLGLNDPQMKAAILQ